MMSNSKSLANTILIVLRKSLMVHCKEENVLNMNLSRSRNINRGVIKYVNPKSVSIIGTTINLTKIIKSIQKNNFKIIHLLKEEHTLTNLSLGRKVIAGCFSG